MKLKKLMLLILILTSTGNAASTAREELKARLHRILEPARKFLPTREVDLYERLTATIIDATEGGGLKHMDIESVKNTDASEFIPEIQWMRTQLANRLFSYLFPEHEKERDRLLPRLNAVLAKNKLTYFEYLDISEEFTIVITGRTPNNSLPKSRTVFIHDGLSGEKQEVSPIFLLLPSYQKKTVEHFIRSRALLMSYLGLTVKPLKFDGSATPRSSNAFFVHDKRHALVLAEVDLKDLYGHSDNFAPLYSPYEWDYFLDKLEWRIGFTQDFLEWRKSAITDKMNRKFVDFYWFNMVRDTPVIYSPIAIMQNVSRYSYIDKARNKYDIGYDMKIPAAIRNSYKETEARLDAARKSIIGFCAQAIDK